MKLNWSRNLGCFERHLQRKCGNPLFPPDVRSVTQAQVDDARARDWIDAEEVRERFRSLLRRIADEPAPITGADALDVRTAFDDLLTRAAEIGDALKHDAPAIFQMYESVVRDILAAIGDNRDLTRQLHDALALSRHRRRLFNNPFIAQLRRRDTPIRPDEVVPSLLTESPETIRLTIEVLADNPEVVGVLQRSAARLVANSPEARDILRKQPEKLSALGLDAQRVN